jgi:hypothetical protein
MERRALGEAIPGPASVRVGDDSLRMQRAMFASRAFLVGLTAPANFRL